MTEPFTVAAYIGVPPDKVLEAACAEFRSQCAKMKQAEMQHRKPTIKERRKMEWEAAQKIVDAYKAAVQQINDYTRGYW